MQACAFVQDDLVTTAQAAEIVGRSVATVNRWAAEGQILVPAFQFPQHKGARMFRRADVEAIAATQAERDGDAA